MEQELIWGMPVIGYLFLAGLGAGALVTSTSMLLRGGPEQHYFRFARYGAILSVPLAGIGVAMLILELGSFQTGHWFRWINLYKVITLSPMSIGSWLLLLYFIFAAAYTLLFIMKGTSHDDNYQSLRRKLAWACLPLGIGVAVYTGILLGAMPARPLWNSPILALLFLISSISTGIAAVLVIDWLMTLLGRDKTSDTHHHTEACYLLASTDTLLISLEIAVILLFFMYAHLAVGDQKSAIAVFQSGGELASQFWFGVVALGLMLPVFIELYRVMPRLLETGVYQHRGMAVFVVPMLVLVGGFMLRYVIVVGGQIARLASI